MSLRGCVSVSTSLQRGGTSRSGATEDAQKKGGKERRSRREKGERERGQRRVHLAFKPQSVKAIRTRCVSSRRKETRSIPKSKSIPSIGVSSFVCSPSRYSNRHLCVAALSFSRQYHFLIHRKACLPVLILG